MRHHGRASAAFPDPESGNSRHRGLKTRDFFKMLEIGDPGRALRMGKAACLHPRIDSLTAFVTMGHLGPRGGAAIGLFHHDTSTNGVLSRLPRPPRTSGSGCGSSATSSCKGCCVIEGVHPQGEALRNSKRVAEHGRCSVLSLTRRFGDHRARTALESQAMRPTRTTGSQGRSPQC